MDHVPPGSRGKSVSSTRLLGRASQYGAADALFLEVDPAPDPTPSPPLKVFTGKVGAGETLYLAVVPHGAGGRQRIFEARAGALDGEGHTLWLELTEPVRLEGLSGAPVINEKGYAVGILTAGVPEFADAGNGSRTAFAQGIRPLRHILTD